MKKYLFDVNPRDGKVAVQDRLIKVIPEFRELLAERNGDDCMAYLILMYDYNSPYIGMPEEDRRSHLIIDVFKKERSSVIDKDVFLRAVTKYNALQYNPLIHTYHTHRAKLYQINKYLEGQDISGAEKAEEISKLLVMQEKIVQSIESTRKRIETQGEEESKIAGGDRMSFLEEMLIEEKGRNGGV